MSQGRGSLQWLLPIIAIYLMLAPHCGAVLTTLVYSTDFEGVTKRDANQLNMGIENWFEFGGDGGASMWMEGLERKTPGITCHSGSRCVGMELTDITKSRRNQFDVLPVVGFGYSVSVWLYLPPDWQLHLSRNWYQIVNPYFTGPPEYLPYSAIDIVQNTTSPVFDLSINYRDLTGAQHMWDHYANFSLPRGRWFQVQYYVLRSSTDGILRVWFDGTLVTSRSGLQTKGPIEDWFTVPAKIYYDTNDRFSPYRIWVDDLEIYNTEPQAVTTTPTSSSTATTSTGEVPTVTSVSLNAQLDAASSPPTVLISGSIHPAPGVPVNVTLEFRNNQSGNFQEIARVTSTVDGTFSYSWKAPGNGVLMIRADAQGMKSSAVSIGMSAGTIPGFPLESLLVGSALGLLFALVRQRQRADRRVLYFSRRRAV